MTNSTYNNYKAPNGQDVGTSNLFCTKYLLGSAESALK